MKQLLLAAVLLAAGLSATATDNPLARFRTLSDADCVTAANMVAESDAAPVNATYMRVQSMGDPGTAELAGEITNVVTWNVGAFTGLDAPAAMQRGFRDQGPPAPESAFQLSCDSAGFFIDTSRFSHTVALVGQGPNVSIARTLSPPIPAFSGGASLLVEADIRVPWMQSQAAPVFEGTAQLGFFVYLQDRRSGTVVAQLASVYDNRPPGVDGSGVEGLGSDGFTAFISSPLAPFDGLGRSVRFVTSLPQMQYVDTWVDSRHFSVVVTPANFAAALAQLRQTLPALSADPSDYSVTLVGVGGEVIAGTGNEHNVSLGASASGLVLRELPVRHFISR
jgi:hypothetical protein